MKCSLQLINKDKNLVGDLLGDLVDLIQKNIAIGSHRQSLGLNENPNPPVLITNQEISDLFRVSEKDWYEKVS